MVDLLLLALCRTACYNMSCDVEAPLGIQVGLRKVIPVIYGIGHDVLEIDRMAAIIEGKHAEAFIQRVLTPAERDLAVQRKGRLVEYVSGRFAAKEAVTKAFGCGIGKIIGFQDINILPTDTGKPVVHISATAWDRLALPGEREYKLHLSITHQPQIASAFVVVEQSEQF